MADSFDVIVIDAGRAMTANQAIDDDAGEDLVHEARRFRAPARGPQHRRPARRRDRRHRGRRTHPPLVARPNHNAALRLLAAGRYNHPTHAEELLNAIDTLACKWGLNRQVFG